MSDQDRLDPFLSQPSGDASTDPYRDPFGAPTEPVPTAPVAAAGAGLSGRTARRTDAVRAGMIVGTGLVVVLGAAVAMGASPDPAPTGAGAGPAAGGSADPGSGDPGRGPRGLPFGGFGGFGPSAIGPFGGPGPFGADGQGKGFGGPGRDGLRSFGQITVTAVSGSSVSLATEDGWTRTITVGAGTTITKGGSPATLADLAVGDVVRFAETRNADGTFAITKLEIVLPQVAGTVTSVTADTITITLRDGTSTTLRTSGSTTYHVEESDGKRSDVTVGATIVATGERAADGSLTARSVWVQLPRVAGTVRTVGSATLTIARRDGTTVTVHVGSDTTIRVAGVDAAKLSDIKTGMVVIVEGSQRADGSLDARVIGAGDGRIVKGLGKGHVGPGGGGPGASSAPSASGTTDG